MEVAAAVIACLERRRRAIEREKLKKCPECGRTGGVHATNCSRRTR